MWIPALTVGEQSRAYEHAQTTRANVLGILVAIAVALFTIGATVAVTFLGSKLQAEATIQAAREQTEAQATLQKLYAPPIATETIRADAPPAPEDGGFSGSTSRWRRTRSDGHRVFRVSFSGGGRLDYQVASLLKYLVVVMVLVAQKLLPWSVEFLVVVAISTCQDTVR